MIFQYIYIYTFHNQNDKYEVNNNEESINIFIFKQLYKTKYILIGYIYSACLVTYLMTSFYTFILPIT